MNKNCQAAHNLFMGQHVYLICGIAMHAVDRISNLLEIENELGVPSGKTPALRDVVDYLETV